MAFRAHLWPLWPIYGLRAFAIQLVGQALAHPLRVAEDQSLAAGAGAREASLRSVKQPPVLIIKCIEPIPTVHHLI